MKRSGVFLLALSCMIGPIIFTIKKTQANNIQTARIPVPVIKPAAMPIVETSLDEFRLDLSSPKEPGSYGRLSLDAFLTKSVPLNNLDDTLPNTAIQQIPSEPEVKQHASKQSHEYAALDPHPLFDLGKVQISDTQTVKLPYLPDIDAPQFMDRVVDMAEASPLQPDARGCGTLKQSNLKSAPKHAKVRSVGMQRQLTGRASIGVEYVYKDSCYKNAIAPLGALDMPGDDGVNLRFNMRF